MPLPPLIGYGRSEDTLSCSAIKDCRISGPLTLLHVLSQMLPDFMQKHPMETRSHWHICSSDDYPSTLQQIKQFLVKWLNHPPSVSCCAYPCIPSVTALLLKTMMCLLRQLNHARDLIGLYVHSGMFWSVKTKSNWLFWHNQNAPGRLEQLFTS